MVKERAVDRRRVVGGDDLGVGRDPFDEAGQDPAGTDLDEGRDARGGHPLDVRHPIDATSEVLDQLAAGDPSAVVIGRASALARSGTVGSAKAIPASAARIPSAASAISGEWAATETGRTIARLAPSVLASSGAGLDGRPLAGHDDLARGVAVGHDEDAVGRGALDQFGEPGVVEADERRHRAVATLAGGLHQPAALADEADAVVEREAPAATSAVYCPIEWPAMKAGTGSARPLGRPALAERGEDRDRGGEDRRLGVLGPVQAFGRALPGEVADRSPSASSAFAKTAAAAGESSATARPMPTVWDPWPGHTKAR